MRFPSALAGVRFAGPLMAARFVRRLNRFAAVVELAGEPARAGSYRGSGGPGTWIVARPPKANSYHFFKRRSARAS